MKKLITLISILMIFPLVNAMEYKIGNNITLSLTNATDGTILTGKTCVISISNSSGTIQHEQAMIDNGDGSYFWVITGLDVNLEEKYLAKGNCTIGSNQWFTWMYFWLVDDPLLSESILFNGTLSKIQACGSGVSNLTTSDLADTNSSLATAEEIFNGTLSSHDPSDVWSYATRTLTQNITQNATLTASDVWNYATRTLTSFGSLVTNIWDYTFRNLTSSTWGSLPSFLNTSEQDKLNRINISVNTSGVSQDTNYYNSTMNIIIPE